MPVRVRQHRRRRGKRGRRPRKLPAHITEKSMRIRYRDADQLRRRGFERFRTVSLSAARGIPVRDLHYYRSLDRANARVRAVMAFRASGEARLATIIITPREEN